MLSISYDTLGGERWPGANVPKPAWNRKSRNTCPCKFVQVRAEQVRNVQIKRHTRNTANRIIVLRPFHTLLRETPMDLEALKAEHARLAKLMQETPTPRDPKLILSYRILCDLMVADGGTPAMQANAAKQLEDGTHPLLRRGM